MYHSFTMQAKQARTEQKFFLVFAVRNSFFATCFLQHNICFRLIYWYLIKSIGEHCMLQIDLKSLLGGYDFIPAPG